MTIGVIQLAMNGIKPNAAFYLETTLVHFLMDLSKRLEHASTNCRVSSVEYPYHICYNGSFILQTKD